MCSESFNFHSICNYHQNFQIVIVFVSFLVRRKPRPRQTTLREKIEKIKEKLEAKNSDIFSDSDDSDFEELAKNFCDDDRVGTFESEPRNLEKPKVVKKIVDFFDPKPSVSCRSGDVGVGVGVDRPTNSLIDDFLLEASFDVGLSQMNDSDYQVFTQFDDESGNQPTGCSAARRAATADVDSTTYRDVIESDDSFEFGLSQMKEPDGPGTDDGCTPTKLQKVSTATTVTSPMLSNKLSSKLSLKKN